MYKLGKGREAFEIVDGPDAGLRFERNKIYDRVPAGYEDHFDRVRLEKAPEKTKDPKPMKPVVKPDIEGDSK